MNLRFRHKLLLAFALLLVVTLLPVLVLVNTQIERISAEKITDDLVNTRRVFRRFQQNQISGYSERTSAFILTQPEVRAEIATLSEQGGLFADATTGGPPPVGSKAIPQLSAASQNKPVRRAGAKAGSDPFGAVSEQGAGSAEGKAGSDPFGAASEQGGGSAEGKAGSDPFGAVSEQGAGSAEGKAGSDPFGAASEQDGGSPGRQRAPEAAQAPSRASAAVPARSDPGALASALPDRQNLLLSVVEDVRLYRESEIFFLADPHGQLIFNKADPRRFGDDLRQLPEVAGALRGQEIFTWWGSHQPALARLGLMPGAVDAPRLYQVFLKPVVFGREVRGLIGIGFALSHADLEEIIGITRSEIAFLVGGQVYLNSLAGLPPDTLLPLTAAAGLAPADATPPPVPAAVPAPAVEPADSGRAEAQQFRAHDEDYLALVVPMTSSLGNRVGTVVVYRSKTREMLVYDQLRTLLNVIGIAALAVAGLLALLISRTVTRALNMLFAGVGEVQKGNLAHRLDLRSRDEFGEVGKAFNEMTAGLQEKEAIRRTFKRYVSSSVVDELLRNTDGVKLGGESKVLTVQFSDIAGFTNLSEGMRPQQVVEFLNDYLSEMTAEVEAEQGIVDKYIGDAVMAFWGAPLALDNPALHACRAALAQLRKSRALARQWAERGELSRFHIRIGLHTGEVVVGNIGSDTRMDYTIIGDSVNVASRLEGINKVYGTQLIVSEATRACVEQDFVFRELDLIRVVGKTEPVRVYELVGAPGEASTAQQDAHAHFAAGLQAYRRREFQAALARFRAAQAEGPDAPAGLFAQRCEAFLREPPPPEWQGVYDATSK